MNPEQKSKFQQKVNWNKLKYSKLCERFDIFTHENKNNIYRFTLGGKTFYFDIVKGKIKDNKTKKWTGKIVTYLKEEFKGHIPLVSETAQPENENDMFSGWDKPKEIIIKGFEI